MAEQVQNSFIQRCMNDFTTGASWVPTAPGPTGHARPGGSRLSDSPVRKWCLDVIDRIDPRGEQRAVLRAAGSDPDARVRALVRDAAVPALESAREALAADGYAATLEHDETTATLSVVNYNGSQLVYAVAGHVYAQPAASLADVYRAEGRRYAVLEIRSLGRKRTRRPGFCSRRALQRDCLLEMRKALLW